MNSYVQADGPMSVFHETVRGVHLGVDTTQLPVEFKVFRTAAAASLR